MLVKSGEGVHEYRVIRNGVGEILMVNKFGHDETNNKCNMVAELHVAPGQCTGFHAHNDDVELFICLKENWFLLRTEARLFLSRETVLQLQEAQNIR